MRDRHDVQTQLQPIHAAPPPARVRVLIIDDNRSFADMLSAALDTVEDIKCVGTAASAAEGLARTAELKPTVVVMDIMMPGIDGIAATRELMTVSPSTAVVVVSAHSDVTWIERAAHAGASAYILKGGSLSDVIEGLRSARPGAALVAPASQPVCSSWPRAVAEPTGTGHQTSLPSREPGQAGGAPGENLGRLAERGLALLRIGLKTFNRTGIRSSSRTGIVVRRG